jgi:hypothetical protein
MTNWNNWRAGNIARSRLSGGSSRIRTRPRKRLGRGRQASLHGILLNIGPNAIKLLTGADQPIEAFLLPKGPVRTQETIRLVSGKSLERAQPLGGKHMRGDQQVDMIRHHNEGMEVIPVQNAVAVPQRGHHDLCNFRPPQEQRAIRTCVEKPINGYERLARRDQSGRWDKQRLLHHVPMWQPPYIMLHTSSRCFRSGEILTLFNSRLKAGCGQYCPPSIYLL